MNVEFNMIDLNDTYEKYFHKLLKIIFLSKNWMLVKNLKVILNCYMQRQLQPYLIVY